MAEDMEAAELRLREAYDAFNRGDFDAAVAAVHPEVEWHRRAEVEGVLHGRRAVRQFMQPDVFERQQTEILELSIHGDKILVLADFLGVAAGSGIELRQRSYQLWTIRDGLAATLRVFVDRDEALRAAEGEVSAGEERRRALLDEMFAAYNREDWEALKRGAHPEVEVQRPGGLGVTRGREAVAERMAPEVMARQRVEVHEVEMRGEVALVHATHHATGSGSGIEINQPNWVVYRFDGDLVRRLEIYHDREEALAAAWG